MSTLYKDAQVGDVIKRIRGSVADTIRVGNTYTVRAVGQGGLWVEGDEGHYAPQFFELITRPSNIQVGDTVRRTAWVPTSLQTDYPVMQVGAAFEVTNVHHNTGVLYFDETGTVGWSIKCFQKVEEPTVERLAANVAAELLIEGTAPLQYYWRGEWYDVEHPHSVTVGRISKVPFRIKPKTIEINGVSVLAPVKLKQGTKVYYADIGRGNVQEAYVGGAVINYWATKEDAQAVLDATLLPFKDL